MWDDATFFSEHDGAATIAVATLAARAAGPERFGDSLPECGWCLLVRGALQRASSTALATKATSRALPSACFVLKRAPSDSK
jgi:hypothetical protein